MKNKDTDRSNSIRSIFTNLDTDIRDSNYHTDIDADMTLKVLSKHR
jgi:uncharacterized protein YqeY